MEQAKGGKKAKKDAAVQGSIRTSDKDKDKKSSPKSHGTISVQDQMLATILSLQHENDRLEKEKRDLEKKLEAKKKAEKMMVDEFKELLEELQEDFPTSHVRPASSAREFMTKCVAGYR